MINLIGRVVKMAIVGGDLLDFEVVKVKTDMFNEKIVWLECVDFGCPRGSMPLTQFIATYGEKNV